MIQIKTFFATVLCLVCLCRINHSYPVTEPAYPVQYIRQQNVPVQYQTGQQQYLQQLSIQPQYITANAVREPNTAYSSLQQPQQIAIPRPTVQRVTQLLLPTNVDRQVQIVF